MSLTPLLMVLVLSSLQDAAVHCMPTVKSFWHLHMCFLGVVVLLLCWYMLVAVFIVEAPLAGPYKVSIKISCLPVPLSRSGGGMVGAYFVVFMSEFLLMLLFSMQVHLFELICFTSL